MPLPMISPQHLDETLRPLLDQLEGDFKLKIRYSWQFLSEEQGTTIDFTFLRREDDMHLSIYDERVEQAVALLRRWVKYFEQEASRGSPELASGVLPEHG